MMNLPEDFKGKALELLKGMPDKSLGTVSIIRAITDCSMEDITDDVLLIAERNLLYLKQTRRVHYHERRNGVKSWSIRKSTTSKSDPPPPPTTPLGAPTRYPSWLSVSNGWIYTICDDGTIWRASEADPTAWHALPGVPQP